MPGGARRRMRGSKKLSPGPANPPGIAQRRRRIAKAESRGSRQAAPETRARLPPCQRLFGRFAAFRAFSRIARTGLWPGARRNRQDADRARGRSAKGEGNLPEPLRTLERALEIQKKTLSAGVVFQQRFQ